jgi:hypothetical protein
MPPVSFNFLPSGSTGEFVQKGVFSNTDTPRTGKVALTDQFLRRGNDPTNAIPTLTHELTHASQKAMVSQSLSKDAEDKQTKQQFLDAYSKLNYDPNKRGRSAFAASDLSNKLNPTWTEQNERYRASSNELPAWAMGDVANRNPLYRYDDYGAPTHLNPTLATERQILLDLATRDARANPNKRNR